MTILDKIVASKKVELDQKKSQATTRELEKSKFFKRELFSVKKQFLDSDQPGVIAEFKRKSPSKGIINDHAEVENVTKAYQEAGASAISILTNLEYFMGLPKDIETAREHLNIPILRKEFMVDEYQIVEAKAMGADFILLIASILTKTEVKQFASLAKNLGLEVLMEVHEEKELGLLVPELDLVGVNNRNLKTFEVDINCSLELEPKIPGEFVKISESGISNPEAVKELFQAGYNGFLIGENFMKTENPGKACKEFIEKMTS